MVRITRTALLLSICLFLYSPTSTGQITSLLTKADSLSQAEKYEEAIQFLEQFILQYPNRKMDEAKARFLMSYNYMQLGNYTLAERNNAQSLRIRNRLGSDEIAENYMRAGSLRLLEGDFESAFDQLFKARELPTEDPQIYALINGYIGSAFAALGNSEKALKYYQESLEILEIELGEDHPDVATTHYNIAKVHLAQGRRDATEEQLNKALELESTYGKRQSQLGNIYNAQGTLAYEFGNDDKALDYYQKALDAFQSTYGSQHKETGRTFLNLARVKLSLSKRAEAKKDIQASLESLTVGYNAGDFAKTPDRNNIFLDRILLTHVLTLKSAIHLLDFEEEINNEHLKNALATSNLGIEILEDHFDLLTGEASKLRLLENHQDLYENGIIAGIKLQARIGDIAYAEKAFEFAEKSKANILRSHVIPIIEAGNDFAIARRLERRTRSFIQEAEVALDLNPNDEKLWQRLREKRAAYSQFLEQLNDKQPEYYNLRYNHSVVRPQDIQESLAEDEILLSYFVGRTQYYIFAITAEDFSTHALASTYGSFGQKLKSSLMDLQKNPKDLGTGVGIYSKLDIKDLPVPPLNDAIDGYLLGIKKMNSKNFAIYSNSLYGKLIYPIRSMLKGKEKLIIIPHGKLSSMPFEALISNLDKPEKIKYHKLDYLIKDYNLKYQHSATLYWKSKQRYAERTSGSSFLGLAPVFNADDKTGYIWNSHDYIFDTTYQNDSALRAISPSGKRFSTLQYSENEVVTIAELFAKEQQESKAFLHAEATEAQFKAEAKQYKYLHIASHSFINEANPKLSGIAFAQPDSEDSKEDGILYTSEIYGLETGAELVVLSSCDSGSGQLVSGEGVLSLSRAFQYAGVNNVVSSLWKVYDSYTSQLMVPFYDELLEGAPYDQALRTAKLKMIKNKRAAAPRKWAGFVLFGNE
jgi:CHAT domain-containing protein/Flp pilus assembly protein TadD